jgi:hypothetical protein
LAFLCGFSTMKFSSLSVLAPPPFLLTIMLAFAY